MPHKQKEARPITFKSWIALRIIDASAWELHVSFVLPTLSTSNCRFGLVLATAKSSSGQRVDLVDLTFNCVGPVSVSLKCSISVQLPSSASTSEDKAVISSIFEICFVSSKMQSLTAMDLGFRCANPCGDPFTKACARNADALLRI